MSLKKQLMILFVLIQIIILGLIFYYFIQNHTGFYLEQLENSLKNECKLLVNNKKINFYQNTPGEIDSWVKKMGKDIGIRITIIKKDGEVIADSTYNPDLMDNHADRSEIKEVLNGSNTGVAERRSKTLDKKMYYLAHPLIDEGEIVGVVRLAKSLKAINQTIIRNIRSYFLFLPLILIITLLLVWYFSSNLINPLSKMTEMAADIARGNFDKRIELKQANNEIGTMTRMFNYMADQLEQKIREISDEKNRAEAILSSMVDGVIATDKNRKIVLVNPAARQILYTREQNFEGKELIEIVRNHRIDNLLQEAIEESKNVNEIIVINNPDQKYLQCHFAPITDREGTVGGGVIVLTDITELRNLEQVRKDFVANVSHELRTPLTSIIGYVDTLLDNKIKDSQMLEKFLKIIKKEADRLSLLIKDLLNLSKIEGKNPDLKPGRLESVINKPLRILKETAAKKNITIKKELEANLPLVFMISDQIEQVFINLIDNSIKYNKQGGEIIIRAYEKEDIVAIEIEDDGIGIPKKDQERIFERFYRVDKARSRSLGGTGIGLSIVKNIIKGHDSEIEVESSPGQGTLFRFYLHKVK